MIVQIVLLVYILLKILRVSWNVPLVITNLPPSKSVHLALRLVRSVVDYLNQIVWLANQISF
jgi:hypothetical protein